MNTIEKISVSQLKNIGLEMSVLDDDIILSNNIEIKNKIFDTPCRLDGFVLLFCTNGEAEIQINFQEYKIHPGILVMNIPENVIYISNVKKQVKMVPWNGFIYGIMIVLILNSFVFPYIFNKQIVETDYGTFISNIEKGEVQEVSIDQNCIYFATKENGKPVFYKTGAIDDPELVDRLLNAKSSNESVDVDCPWRSFLSVMVGNQQSDEKTYGRCSGQCDVIRKQWSQDLCRLGGEDHICRCSRPGRGKRRS